MCNEDSNRDIMAAKDWRQNGIGTYGHTSAHCVLRSLYMWQLRFQVHPTLETCTGLVCNTRVLWSYTQYTTYYTKKVSDNGNSLGKSTRVVESS